MKFKLESSVPNMFIINILILIIAGLSLLVLYLGLRLYTLSGSQLIPASQAKRLIKSGEITQIIDVRTKLEYDSGHFPNAIHIPVNNINYNTTKELDKNKTILLYCNTGQRARYAANKMNNLGFNKVYYIDGTYKTIL